MKSLLLWNVISILLIATNSQKIILYGEPTFTSESGFIRIDDNNGWKVAANGFATSQLSPSDAIAGLAINTQRTSGILYGSFALWNSTFVGGFLNMDPLTLECSFLNTGVIGSVYSATYFDNGTQFAFVGNLFTFQKNPTIELNQVGACTSDGKNCYPLGPGLSNYNSYGQILNFDETLYVYYMGSNAESKIDYFDEISQQWINILNTNQIIYIQVKVAVYREDLWIFGCYFQPNNTKKGAARWNSTENLWEFMDNNTIICQYSYMESSVSVSPNGQTAYFHTKDEDVDYVFIWNQTLLKWELDYQIDTGYSPVMLIAARNEGVLIAYANTSVSLLEDGIETEILSDIECENTWLSLQVNNDDTVLYALCQNEQDLIATSYNLTQNSTSANSTTSGFESLLIEFADMCAYGKKLLVTGKFTRVNNIAANGIALWDGEYNKWYSFQSDAWYQHCRCSTDGDQIAIMCTASTYGDPPVVMFDTANTDTGNGIYANFPLTNMTGLVDLWFTYQIQLISDGTIFIGARDIQSQLVLYQWNKVQEGSIVVSFPGSGFYFYIQDNTAFLGGSFYAGTNPSSNFQNTTARYNLVTQEWLPMDEVYIVSSNVSQVGQISEIVSWELTGYLYAGGWFTQVGTTKVFNWVGYNYEGRVSDTVQGGVPSEIKDLQPLGSRMYLIYSSSYCAPVDPNCNKLIYYDGVNLKYSNAIAGAVGSITAEPAQSSDQQSSSKTEKSILLEILIPVIVVCSMLMITTIALVLYRRVRNRTKDYQEIPDLPQAAYSTVIDFQTEQFVLKSVLGRGAYGTVWSVVFPKREAATYAVKQMLFSKGDTKRIEIVKQEIDLLEKLRHPYIVHYCGHRVENSNTSIEFFIFMELYEQPCSLKGVIQKRLKQAQKTGSNQWFTYKEIKKFLFQISDGLNYLHGKGVAHRDLKCANLLIRAKGSSVHSIHIADFGIARVMNEEGLNPLASTVLGTPSFMAPEILKNQRYDPFKADMWSVGMTIFELLSWKEPEQPGMKPTLPKEVMQYLNKDERFASVLEIFDRCSQQEPSARTDASELLVWCESLP